MKLSSRQREALAALVRFEGRFVGTREAGVQGNTLEALAGRGLVELRVATKPYNRYVARLTPEGLELGRRERKRDAKLEADDKNRAAVAAITAEREAAGRCRHCGGPVPCWSSFGDVAVGVRHGSNG